MSCPPEHCDKLAAAQLEAAYRRGKRDGFGGALIVAGLTVLIAAPALVDIIGWLRGLGLIP